MPAHGDPPGRGTEDPSAWNGRTMGGHGLGSMDMAGGRKTAPKGGQVAGDWLDR